MRLLLLVLTLALCVLAWFGPPLDAEAWGRPLGHGARQARAGRQWWLAYEPRYELRVELRAAAKDAAHRWIEVDVRSFDAAAIGGDLALVSYPFLAPVPAPAPDTFVAVELLRRASHARSCASAAGASSRPGRRVCTAAIALGAVRARRRHAPRLRRGTGSR